MLLAVLCLPNVVWLPHDTSAVIPALVLPAAELAITFAIFGRWPWVLCALLTPFALLSPLETYYISLYHHPTSAEVIATLVATNPLEIREYFGTLLVPLAMMLAAGALVGGLAAWCAWKARLRLTTLSRVAIGSAGLAVLVLGLAALPDSATGSSQPGHASTVPMAVKYGTALTNGYPAGVLPRVALYHLEWRQMRREALRLESFRFHAHRVAPAPHQRQIYVLVIGESSRRANWQLFGYTRATNPRLSKLANLVRLPDFVTTWPESITAIPIILTRRRPKTPWYVPQGEASILRAMEEAGYATYWLSNQQAIGKFDSPVSMYAYEAQHVEWLNHASWMAPNSYDGDLVAPLENVIAGSKQDLFIVLHTMGSHNVYAYRYPKGFRKWGSVPPHGDTQESRVKADSYDKHTVDDLRNSYDNSILYSDYVLSKIIGVLKATGDVSALWFESDHGEVLPTPSCSLEGHGIGTT